MRREHDNRDCARCHRSLRALLDGELSGPDAQGVVRHLEGCFDCSREYERLQRVTSLVQETPPEDPPPHFDAGLQVRLRRHRQARARFRLPASLRWPTPAFGRPALAGVLTLAVASVLLLGRRIDASEIARRTVDAWGKVQNYGCVWLSTGRYQGAERRFYQRQFFRKPGEFRLDTSQDYPLETYVYEDRVIHYLPGGDWQGRGPLVIIRPRVEARNVLPFPFGVTWQGGGNVSLDALVRQLDMQSPELIGTETVGSHECYHLRMEAANLRRDRFDIWVDRQVYLPRRVQWHRDSDNSITTEAQDLQVNYSVLPAGTFEFRIPDGAFVVQGDVDPHVLALPRNSELTMDPDGDPVTLAATEAMLRSSRLPFRVGSPSWMPEGFKLVRVRVRSGAWLDAHWLRSTGDRAEIVKLVTRVAGSPQAEDGWNEHVQIIPGPEGPVPVRWRSERTPFRHVTLTWEHGGAQYVLSAAGLELDSALQIARSVLPAPVVVRITSRSRGSSGPEQMVSAAPGDATVADANPEEGGDATDPVSEPAPPEPQVLDMPGMMPEMADEDQAGPAREATLPAARPVGGTPDFSR